MSGNNGEAQLIPTMLGGASPAMESSLSYRAQGHTLCYKQNKNGKAKACATFGRSETMKVSMRSLKKITANHCPRLTADVKRIPISFMGP